jgi:hypothetical protein
MGDEDFLSLEYPSDSNPSDAQRDTPELSIQELRRMTDDIAAYIQQTKNLPEGLHDALNMVFAHLAGRRECAALFRSQTLKDGQDRSKEDAGHQKAIGDFKDIYSTLRNAVALAASKKTLQTPLAKRSKSLNGIRYTIPDGLLSNRADDTPVPSEQRGTQPMQVATTTGTATLPNYNSNLRRGLDSLASIRRSVRVTWCDYRVRKSDLYDATQLSRHAFALSRGVIAELIAKSTGSKPLLESVMELRERLGKTGTGSDYDDLCCVRASKILALMHESVVLRHSDSEDVSSRRLKLTQRCKDYHPLAYHLCFVIGLLPERAKGQRQGVALYEQTDPLLLTFYQLCNVQEVTLEAIVVVQLYLELYETAGMPNLRHIETLTATAKIMKRSLLALNYADRNFEKQPLSLELTSEPGQAFRRIADEVIVLGEADSKLAKGDASPKSVLRFLLIHFPILCGMVYTSMISNFYLDGIQVSQYDSRVTAAARLYRTTEFVVSSQKWAQLEDFVALQGKDTLGLMGCDGDDYEPVSAAIELSIALGIPRTDFEKLELKNDGLTDRLPLPHITTAGALALPRNRSLLGAEQETMSQIDRATITSPGQSRCVLQLLVRDKMRQPQMAAAHPEIHNALRRQDRLCPVHLLEILSESLAADSQHLKFNHHDLTLSCWELLRTITSDHGGTLLASRSFFFEDAASGRSNVVDDVMWEVIALGVIAEDDPAHPGTSSSVLYKIAPALDKSFTRDSSKPS